MFFPLGLGGLPIKFPLATFILFLLSFGLSGYYLADVQNINKELASEYKKYEHKLEGLRSKLIYKHCLSQNTQNECVDAKRDMIFANAGRDEKTSILKDRLNKLAEPADSDKEESQAPTARTNWSSKLQFQADENKWPRSIRDEPEYLEYREIKKEGQKKIRASYDEIGVLSIDNISFKSFLISTFIHGSVVHFLSNMLFFLALGSYVEQRLGFFTYTASALVGSLVGATLQIYMTPEFSLLGFSGAVYTVLGIFYALFYKKYLKVFCFYFVGGKSLFLPVYWSIPVLYVINDLLLLGQAANSKVGHFIHVGGFVFGCLVGFIKRKWDNLEDDFSYPEERVSYLKLKDSLDCKSIVDNYNNCLSWNWQNRSTSLLFFTKMQGLNCNGFVSEKDTSWISQHLSHLFGIIYFEKNDEELSYWIELVPSFLDSAQVYEKISVQRIVHLADILATKGQFDRSGWFYEHALSRKPTQKIILMINGSLNKLALLKEDKEAV